MYGTRVYYYKPISEPFRLRLAAIDHFGAIEYILGDDQNCMLKLKIGVDNVNYTSYIISNRQHTRCSNLQQRGQCTWLLFCMSTGYVNIIHVPAGCSWAAGT